MLTLLAFALIGYPWPLAPMNQQHPISGTFAEYRTGPPPHFHAAVDIPDPEGTPVYAVEAGEVLWLGSGGNGGVRVGRFAYVHVVPRADLQLGDWVPMGELVGWLNDYNHVHFKDGGGASGLPTRNPLLPPEHLEPFQDTFRPGFYLVKFFKDGLSQELDPQHLSGRVDVVALTMDTTDLNPWGTNNGIYRIGYALYRGDSLVRGPDTVYTFITLPSNSYVHNVYAPWSNNGEHHYIVTNHLETNGYFDFHTLGEGDYTLHLFALDTEGNQAFLSLNLHAEPPDTVPPSQPELTTAWVNPEGKAVLAWHPVPDPCLASYTVYLRFLNGPWTPWATLAPEDTTYVTQDPLPEGWVFGLRVVARDCAGNRSDSSRVFVARRQFGAPRVLFVDGRQTPKPSDLFWDLADHLQTPELWTAAPGAGPEASGIHLWWFLSDTGTARWHPAETTRLASLLDAGGFAVLSGVRWPSVLDSTLLAQRFGTVPGTPIDTAVAVLGIEPPLDGLTFVVPQAYTLVPTEGQGTSVAITAEGTPVGVKTSATLALGFAWSAVEPEDQRAVIARRIADWSQVLVAEGRRIPQPAVQVRSLAGRSLQVSAPAYPVPIEIWDVAGRRVARLMITSPRAVSLESLGSGVYLVRLPAQRQTHKVWILR